jgi:hypothetical protein
VLAEVSDESGYQRSKEFTGLATLAQPPLRGGPEWLLARPNVSESDAMS